MEVSDFRIQIYFEIGGLSDAFQRILNLKSEI